MTSPEDGGLKSWAEVPVILMSLMIAALSFVFFGRRVFKRRRYLDIDDMQCEMKTQDFTTSDHDIDAEKNMHRFSMEDVADGDSVDGSTKKKKKKKKKSKMKLNSSSDRTGSTRSIDASNSTQSDSESKSSSVRQLRNSMSSSATHEDLDDGIKTTKKKNKKKLDDSNRSGASNYSGSTNHSHIEEGYYENETEEERRKRRKKEKKARKRAEKEAMLGNDSPPSLDELCLQEIDDGFE